MYLYLGQSVSVPEEEILGVFDLDNTTWSFRTRRFLERMQAEGNLRYLGEDLPRSFVLCQRGEKPAQVYLSQVNTTTLFRRAQQRGFEEMGGKRDERAGVPLA